MKRTDEQFDFAARLEALIRAVVGERVRLVLDVEGFPIVPGRMGRLEYLGMRSGPDRDGGLYADRLHVFTDRGRIIPKLLAVPGCIVGRSASARRGCGSRPMTP